jgi:hypothetical protein
MANFSPEQRAALEQWAADGATLNDIQHKLKSEFGINITYLDARLLLLDLQVKLKDKPREQPKAEELAPPPIAATDAPMMGDDPAPPPAGNGAVTVTVDTLAIPGALVSGKVTFTDGQTAGWYLDQSGRLGLRAPDPGYRPPPADVPVFQAELDRVLVQAGF